LELILAVTGVKLCEKTVTGFISMMHIAITIHDEAFAVKANKRTINW